MYTYLLLPNNLLISCQWHHGVITGSDTCWQDYRHCFGNYGCWQDYCHCFGKFRSYSLKHYKVTVITKSCLSASNFSLERDVMPLLQLLVQRPSMALQKLDRGLIKGGEKQISKAKGQNKGSHLRMGLAWFVNLFVKHPWLPLPHLKPSWGRLTLHDIFNV